MSHKIPKILSGLIMIVMTASRFARVSAFVLPRRSPAPSSAAARAVLVSPAIQPLPTTAARLFSTTAGEARTVLKRVKTIDAVDPSEDPVIVKGWVRTIRKQKTMAFVQVNDGSNLKGIQCVVSLDDIDEKTKKGWFVLLVLRLALACWGSVYMDGIIFYG
jgi:hypothetical protein